MMLSILAEAGHAEPAAFGLTAEFWLSLAILAVFVLMLWLKVPAIVARILDKRIAEIRSSLYEAAGLRAEAEALKAEYEEKARGAAKEAQNLLANAEAEAAAIVKQAEADATELVARRKKMSVEKIAAAERAAIAEVRAKAADAATNAARSLIALKHDAAADKKLIDEAISHLGSLN